MTAPVLQFKRGLLANLPGLRAGEPGFTTDSYDLYVGIDSTTNNNKFFGSHRYWTKGTASTGSGVNFVEGTTNGTQYITLKGPDNLSGITTYTFPATPTADYFLKTAADGTLSWEAVTLNSFAGIVTFTGTTDNTLGDANTGTVQIDGGVGIEKNLTVGGNLNVQGYSELVGIVTFKGGTITLGDAATDNVVFAADVNSNIIPNTDNTYDLGNGSQRWRNANFSGIVTATTFVGALTGTATSTTNIPNLTGAITSNNTTTSLGSFSSSNLATALTDETGSGSAVFANTPTLVTPILGAASATSIEVSGSVNVGTALSAPTVKVATIQHSNGTNAATIDTSGNLTASQNLTVAGNLYVNGSTTQVNTASMTVEDRTIELGQVDGSAPSSATTWDLGVLFNYNSSGAKKSAVIWEHADGRFKFGSQVSDGGGTDNDSPQITVSNYAAIEVAGLWVNDCAGQSQVINCTGSTRILENITIDGGSF